MTDLTPLENDYCSPVIKVSPWLRIALFRVVYFYFWFFRFTVKNSALAKRGQYDITAWQKSSFDCFKLVEKCGGRFDIKGIENLRGCDAPVVMVGNHMSTLETLVLIYIIAPMKCTFVVKAELLNVPFFKWLVKAQQLIVVSRKNAFDDLRQVYEKGAEAAKDNRSVIIFPQTTRTPNFDAGLFTSIGAKLAKRCKIKLLPLALKTDFLGSGKGFKLRGAVDPQKIIYFEFGTPETVVGGGQAQHQNSIDFIQGRLRSWGVAVK